MRLSLKVVIQKRRFQAAVEQTFRSKPHMSKLIVIGSAGDATNLPKIYGVFLREIGRQESKNDALWGVLG